MKKQTKSITVGMVNLSQNCYIKKTTKGNPPIFQPLSEEQRKFYLSLPNTTENTIIFIEEDI